jgi:hypothetical protein
MTASSTVLLQPIIALFVDGLWEKDRLPASSFLGVAVTVAGLQRISGRVKIDGRRAREARYPLS